MWTNRRACWCLQSLSLAMTGIRWNMYSHLVFYYIFLPELEISDFIQPQNCEISNSGWNIFCKISTNIRWDWKISCVCWSLPKAKSEANIDTPWHRREEVICWVNLEKQAFWRKGPIMGFAFRFIFEQIPVELHINSILPAKRPTCEMFLNWAGPIVALSCYLSFSRRQMECDWNLNSSSNSWFHCKSRCWLLKRNGRGTLSG